MVSSMWKDMHVCYYLTLCFVYVCVARCLASVSGAMQPKAIGGSVR